MKPTRILALGLLASGALLGGCKYYGSALPPEYPLSMDDAANVATDMGAGPGGAQRPIIKQGTRPRVERPSYLPEKELAIVSPPQTLLVWTYPHVTDDNTRVFGNWSTIFLNDRYEWVHPSNEVGLNDDEGGTDAGRPNLGANAKMMRSMSPDTMNAAPPAPAPGSTSMKLAPATPAKKKFGTDQHY